jgi:[ribosomal protein S5]-alanine N-acetyltransferase
LIALETNRLTLRRFSVEDSAFIRELLNDPSFVRNVGDKGVRSVEDAAAYIRNGPIASYERFGFGLYAVELKDRGGLIGMCGLLKRDTLPEPDIGFAFLPEFRMKGYAFESASAVIRHGKDVLGLRRVLAITTPDNIGSIRVLEKIGMRFERMIQPAEDEPELKLFALESGSV